MGINGRTFPKEQFSPEKIRGSPGSQSLCLMPKGCKVAGRCRNSRGCAGVILGNPSSSQATICHRTRSFKSLGKPGSYLPLLSSQMLSNSSSQTTANACPGSPCIVLPHLFSLHSSPWPPQAFPNLEKFVG